jgi:superfamily II DNA or RNA helicase
MANKGVRSNIMVHRQELLEQVAATLDDFEAEHGYIAASEPYSPAPLTHVSSVFTLARRLDKVPSPKYAICDEAHHCIPGSTWANCVDHWNDVFLFGVTATPERLSGEGLGTMFDVMVIGPGTAELMRDGYLCKYKMFAPPVPLDTSHLHMRGGDYKKDEAEMLVNKPSITGNAVAHYRKYLNGAPAVAFCVSRKHAAQVAEDFQAAGFRSASIDGTMKKPARRQMVKDFGNGQLNVMTSCQLINEGFDVPGMHGAILLNPTESLAKYLQECGRTFRVAPGKAFAYLLDHVGNSARHGLPCEEREWSLDSKKRSKRKRDPDDIAIRQCGFCGAVCGASATRCDECGQVFPVKPRTIREIEGELEEVKRVKRKKARVEQGMAKDMDALMELGRMRGIKNPYWWAKMVLEGRDKKRKRA